MGEEESVNNNSDQNDFQCTGMCVPSLFNPGSLPIMEKRKRGFGNM